MNKIYKVLKNHSTGCMVVVSELAKGAKKGNKLKLASIIIFSALCQQTYASVGIPQGYNPTDNSNKGGSLTITGSNQEIDLAIDSGLNSAEKGEEVKKHAITTAESFSALYKTKYTDVTNATSNFNQVKTAFNNGTATQADLDDAQNKLQLAQDNAAAISDSQFKVNDPNNLIGSNTEGTVISEKQSNYTDPVTGKVFEITVKDNLVKTQAGTGISNDAMKIEFYEKTPDEAQYNDMQLVEVSGSGTDVTIKNSNEGNNNQLEAISKGSSGVIQVNDGANLTFDTDVSYYLGSGKSVSQTFKDKDEYTTSTSATYYKVTYKGDNISTVLGSRNINSEDDFNKFNDELIKYIQSNEQVRLDYPTAEAMQAFYNEQISGLYTVKNIVSYDISYTVTKDELAQMAQDQGLKDAFDNRVTESDKDTDIGLKQTSGNHFVAVTGSGSVVTVTENSTIDSKESSGSVIRANFSDSGKDSNNIFKIDGVINAYNKDAILANNAEIYVSKTGVVNGDIVVKTGTKSSGNNSTNLIDNEGIIKGSVTTEDADIINKSSASIGSIIGGNNVNITNNSNATILGNITLNNNGSLINSGSIGGSIIAQTNNNIVNNATINGGIIAREGSTVKNESDGIVGGTVVAIGNGTTFENNGVVGGSHAVNGASSVNNNIIVGDGVVSLSDQASLVNNGQIYIGYAYNASTNDVSDSGSNQKAYTAMTISGNGTELVNNKDIYVSASQHDVNVISVDNGGQYTDKANSVIIFNKENAAVSNVDKDTGNNNKALYVSGSNSKATINGQIQLNDVGSTGLWVQDGGDVILNGIIDINSQNITSNTGSESSVRSFGAWVQGNGSKLTMNGDSEINMNADRAIGVHIRDGASAEILDHAGITFSQKNNQIGFLISGIKDAASIVYNSDKDLLLGGDGSVLFRIERGSNFNVNTISSSNPSLSILDSNGATNSTLIVITNGPVATGSSNQTEADLSGFTLKVNGNNVKGISIEGGAKAIITEETKILFAGKDSILAKVDGKYYDLNGVNSAAYNGASFLESSAHLTTDTSSSSSQMVTGENSIGYYVTNGGKLSHKGSIDFDVPSKNNIGVKIDSGGTLISELGSYIKIQGTAVEISGGNSLATINNVGNGDEPVAWAIGDSNDSAYHVKDNASLKLSGVGITKAQNAAHGILVDGASQIILDGAVLDLYDNNSDSSTGNGIENRSQLQKIQFTNNAQINVKDGYGIHSSVSLSQSSQTSGVINVYGLGTGIRFENIDPTTGNVLGTTNNSINNTGYEKVVVNVYENTGSGIYVDSSQNVNTSASVNIISNTGKAALQIKGSTKTASQSGNLHSANNNSVIVDLNNGYVNNFTNNGELLFGDFTQNSSGQYQFTAQDKETAKDSYAIKTAATENGMSFTNNTNGKINGTVELLGYGTQADPDDKTQGNTVTLIGEGNIFRTGDGNDKFIVNQVVGDDLGGANQVKQFTKLDGGAGDNQIVFNNNSNFTINKDDTINNIGYFALNNKSQVILNDLATIDGLNSGVTTYDIIDAASMLTYKWSNSNTNFDRQLKGNGTFKVDLQNLDSSGKPLNEFAFDDSTNTGDFTGTLELTNSKYTLDNSAINLNTTALTKATLKASDNSYISVGNGDQQIKGLDISGGTIDFGHIDLADDQSQNHITVDNLILNKGNIQIDVSGSIYNPGIPMSLPLLEQDDGIVLTQLVAADNVSGGAINIDIDRSKIKLIDENGNEITESSKSDLVQNGEVIARATYDTRLTKGENNDGLYVGYGLTQVELKVKNDANGNGNALILDATNSDTTKAGSDELDALITDYDNQDGTFSYGDLQIRGSKAVTLSGSNSYNGSTFVKDTSSLISAANNALGFTRLLQLDAGTKFDLNGWNQTVGSLYTNNDAVVDLNGGVFTISGEDGTDDSVNLDSYVSAGSLTGAGKLIIGDESLTRAATHTPQVTIIGDNTVLTADVINAVNGKVNLDSQAGLGSGTLTNNGELNLYFSNDSVLSNSILDGNGVLNKYNSGTLSFTLAQAKDYTGEVNLNAGAMIFSGDKNATTDSYSASKVNIASGASLIGLDNVIFNGDINNSGRFYIGELPNSTTVSENTVTLNNYNGNSGSHLIFNATLNDDSSPINKLIINGDSSGSSVVTVNKVGGLGASTINGIAIIDVNGRSDAEFTQSGRIIAGAYEYKLQRSESNNNNWVLFSDLTTRSEIGSYIGNLFSANNLFNLRLHDRLGETQYTDLFTGEQKVTSMWLRHQYGYDKYRAANGDLSVKDNWNVSQLGGDIAQWSSNGLNRLHLGVMAGYGRSKTKSVANIDNSKSDGTIDGYSYGLYATWYDNAQDKTGLYIDTWALWNDFDASVSGKEFSEKYNLKGLTASVESGYSFKTGTLSNYDVWLQPKAQVTWANVKADDFTESNGTRVSFNNGNLQTRLGLRASMLSNAAIQAQTNNSAQLFIEANWLHNTKLYDVTLNNELTVGQDGARNIGELKVGIEGNIRKNTNVWFNLAGQRGDHNYENASMMLGLKYSF
ncbi:autotransporter outer membrane beta-barrel domain-containing protein [Orbus mooreae]|uniref:autotransporter outer membrane beta-barrel domain-containing protein n=1 Tax=Orbus mooreae TaxID=3074107 RepID=UPI00370D73A8